MVLAVGERGGDNVEGIVGGTDGTVKLFVTLHTYCIIMHVVCAVHKYNYWCTFKTYQMY